MGKSVPSKDQLIKRFWLKVDKNGPTPEPDPTWTAEQKLPSQWQWNGTVWIWTEGPCWIWTGARSGGRYGSFEVERKPVKAHRFAYELEYGPIDKDIFGENVHIRLDLRMLRLPARRTKGKEPKSITLDGDLLKLIEQQRKLHDKKFPSCEYVFPDAEGNQIGYDRALDQFQAACKRAGITEGFTTWDGQSRRPSFHDLRRTFAREADRCGVPHDEIMNIAGWKTHAMLLRYLGAPEDRMRSAFSKMDMSYGKARQTQAAD
ncbi:MAG: hypothetical protein DMG54_30390 [Acidobacteria bacterium]|nr:MAG: hypothetical protein DMG54_30390 [Acidobacteriota bacterium]